MTREELLTRIAELREKRRFYGKLLMWSLPLVVLSMSVAIAVEDNPWMRAFRFLAFAITLMCLAFVQGLTRWWEA